MRSLTAPAWAVTILISAMMNSLQADVSAPVDRDAIPAARQLLAALHGTAPTGTLFGHQNSLAYGYNWMNAPRRSDVREVTGSYPALYGWDLMDLLAPVAEADTYRISETQLLQWAREAHARGGVSTYSWHMANPVTGKSFYDKTPAASSLLPGGDNHAAYKATLDRVARFFHKLDPVPAIFRPYHEHNGDWFWWGKPFVSEQDYITLWRFTVDYLRDVKQVHNLLYAFSPDRSRMDLENFRWDYLYGYPGDDYIDILGLDNYWDVGHVANKHSSENQAADFQKSLELLVKLARERGKLPALTETGSDTLPDPDWYTSVLLAGLDANAITRSVAYVQVWRNANRAAEGRDHFYTPPPGHPAVEDFRAFKASKLILFEDELPPAFRKGCGK